MNEELIKDEGADVRAEGAGGWMKDVQMERWMAR